MVIINIKKVLYQWTCTYNILQYLTPMNNMNNYTFSRAAAVASTNTCTMEGG